MFTCPVYKDFWFFTGQEEDKSFDYVSKLEGECLLLPSINVAGTESAIRDRVEFLSSLSEYLLTLAFYLQA